MTTGMQYTIKGIVVNGRRAMAIRVCELGNGQYANIAEASFAASRIHGFNPTWSHDIKSTDQQVVRIGWL